MLPEKGYGAACRQRKKKEADRGCPLPYRIHFEKQDPADSDQPSGSCFVSAPCSLVRHPPSWQAPGTSCFPQEAGSRGGRRCPPQAMVPFCGSDQRNPGGSGHSVFRSPPKTARTPPRRRRHAALCISFFGFPSSPDVLTALALLHPAQDPGARSRIPFLLLRQVRDVRQIPGFAPPVLSAWTVGSAHFLCHLRSCNSLQKALSRTAFAMERSGRYSGISIAWVA